MDLPNEINVADAPALLKQHQALNLQDLNTLPDSLDVSEAQKLLPFIRLMRQQGSASSGTTSELPSESFGTPIKPTGIPIKGPITQDFGRTDFSQTHPDIYRGAGHNGYDIGVPVGTPLPSNVDGRVVSVGDYGKKAYGKYVVVQGSDGIKRLYGHLSKQDVSVGQTIKPGDLLGLTGATGDATGPHLHYSEFTQNVK